MQDYKSKKNQRHDTKKIKIKFKKPISKETDSNKLHDRVKIVVLNKYSKAREHRQFNKIRKTLHGQNKSLTGEIRIIKWTKDKF